MNGINIKTNKNTLLAAYRDVSAKLDVVQKELKDKTATITTMACRHAKEMASLKTDFLSNKDVEKELTVAKQYNITLLREKEYLATQVKDANSRNFQLVTSLDELRVEYNNVKDKYDELVDSVTNSNHVRKSLTNKVTKLETEIERLDNKNERLTVSYNEVSAKNKVLELKAIELDADIEILTAKKQRAVDY